MVIVETKDAGCPVELWRRQGCRLWQVLCKSHAHSERKRENGVIC